LALFFDVHIKTFHIFASKYFKQLNVQYLNFREAHADVASWVTLFHGLVISPLQVGHLVAASWSSCARKLGNLTQ
jgi:hypothetical protein